MTMTATHSMKARRPSQCNLCRGPVRIGERLVKVGRGGTWVHSTCFNRRFRPDLASLTEGSTR
ncbi:hypothetical protein ACQP2K_30630 [Microbispora siamensis]